MALKGRRVDVVFGSTVTDVDQLRAENARLRKEVASLKRALVETDRLLEIGRSNRCGHFTIRLNRQERPIRLAVVRFPPDGPVMIQVLDP